MTLYLTSIRVLMFREWRRFFRQRSRVVSSLITPILFWGVMGMGFSTSVNVPFSSSYLEYFFPGILLMTLLFSSIFSMISLIEDRNLGFLQSVMVSPASNSAMIFGKIFGAAALSMFQVLLILPLSLLTGPKIHFWMLPPLFGILFLISVLLCSLSFFFAWYLNSSQGFHAVMNILLFPIWLLSGAIFPLNNSSSIIQWISRFNPMTYALDAVRGIFYGGSEMLQSAGYGSISQDLILMLIISICLIFLSFWIVKRSYQ